MHGIWHTLCNAALSESLCIIVCVCVMNGTFHIDLIGKMCHAYYHMQIKHIQIP